MAELVDALVSGTSVRKDVQVRVLFWAQKAAVDAAFVVRGNVFFNYPKQQLWNFVNKPASNVHNLDLYLFFAVSICLSGIPRKFDCTCSFVN
jgi:hypothetical protein